MDWTHIEDTTPVARKDHRCYLCGKTIPKGERHIKRYGIGEDGPISTRMHEDCEKLTKDWGVDDWECFDPSDFRCYLEEAKLCP